MKYLSGLLWTGRILHSSLNLTGWNPGVITKRVEQGQKSNQEKDCKFSHVKNVQRRMCNLSWQCGKNVTFQVQV